MLPHEKQWFFIAGCQRSGTTLMRLVLECHSQIFCFDEAQSYRVLARRTHEGAIDKRLVGFKIPRFSEQLDSPDPRDDGLAEQVGPFYRGQPVIFMVRDPRDVVSSMLKLRGERSWLEEWAISIIEGKAARNPAFASRFARELALCRTLGSNAAYGALYWSFKNDALDRYLSAGHPVLPVRYEALVADPGAELQKVCRFLGVELEAPMLVHAEQAHGELDAQGLAIGNTDPRRSIDAASVGQWTAWLSEREQQVIDEICAPVAARIASILAPRPVAGVERARSALYAIVRARMSGTLVWSLSAWLGMLLSAAAIALHPAWSFGIRDLFFWLAALLTGAPLPVRAGTPSVRGVTADRRRAVVIALAVMGLWLFAQSTQL